MLGFFKSDSYKLGYRTQAIFKISLHKKDYNLLSLIQDYFKVGTITNHGDNSLQYTVKSFKYLDIILDHFDKYPLLSQKCADYQLFKDAITLIKNKEHLSSKGIKKILGIRASMNLGLSDEFKLSFPDIQSVSRPLVGLELVQRKNFFIDPNWIAGLASGDGCFYISIRNSSRTKSGKSVVLKFQIVQHSRDIELMKMLIYTLGCGRIELKLKQTAVYFVVMNFQDIYEKIIPLFDKYPIKGVKALDYSDLKKIANLVQDKEHLTEEDFLKILSIKASINRGLPDKLKEAFPNIVAIERPFKALTKENINFY